MRTIKTLQLYIFIALTLFLYNCENKINSEIKLNGCYGLTEYFQSENTNSDYIETFLLKINKDKVKIFGTVETWGKEYKYKLNKTKDTIELENNFKVYQKQNNSSIICLKTQMGNKTEIFEYQKLPNLEKIIDNKGINSIILSEYLNKSIITGKYKYKNTIIHFNENSGVENFEKFSSYNVIPRLGTNSYYDNHIIQTNNGIWKYQKQNGNLILTKYSNNRDEFESFILGEEKIELKKVVK
ncbi:hypothetical protein [Flavobacterium tibetense]|jgi:hypothetical protein|uniref:Uncharacterized protein n=1 Tax=Flavobacterium tibetense TaxID=2233533 RepID=A0A365P1V9_9FLAO|nr:hypothetical protein [Flavobacterium tibetense]RBA28508.1 hypothetical protein DPN68_07305 [Flavobacterium tibetense]